MRSSKRRPGRASPAFETEGEPGFRANERPSKGSSGGSGITNDRVVAAGGGAVPTRGTAGSSTEADVPSADDRPDIVAARLASSRTVRPLIAGREPTAAVRDLLAARARFYEPAEPIEGGGRIEEVAGRVADALTSSAPDGTRLLSASTAIGRLDIGAGHAARALADAPARLGAHAPRWPRTRRQRHHGQVWPMLAGSSTVEASRLRHGRIGQDVERLRGRPS
jgi:shikimate kinase